MPHQVRFAIHAFRQVKPGEALERRLEDALDAATEGRAQEGARATSKPAARRGSLPLLFAMAGAMAAAAAGGAYCVQILERSVSSPVAKQMELAVQLPDEGHAWVELPVRPPLNGRTPGAVYLDTPASVALHLPSDAEHREYQTVCTEKRCMHRWTPIASSKNRGRPRIRIAEPGRYNFAVTHVSHDTSYREDFVVHAER